MKDLFINAESMWCTQHMENNDAEKLRSLGVNDKDRSRIMADDIYGSQNEILLQNGLVYAENVDDLKARLDSLQPVWDNIVPGFDHWFKQWRSEMFIECLVLSARERHGISGRFTTNGLELKHRPQKKMTDEDEVPKEIFEVSKALKSWIQSYYSEVRRTIRGLGKCRLAPELLNFHVEPATWVQWSEERRNQHYEALLRCIPQVLEYSKPKSACQKPGNS